MGSRNSSNSRRLAELAAAERVPSHLIDGPDDIDLAWFSGDETVLITAGASAPESVVQECVALLASGSARPSSRETVCHEQVSFPLPDAAAEGRMRITDLELHLGRDRPTGLSPLEPVRSLLLRLGTDHGAGGLG